MKLKNICYILLMIILLNSCKLENKQEKIVHFKESVTFKTKTLPIIKIKIGNSNANLLLDSGSEISLIDETYYNKNYKDYTIIDSTTITINTVNNNADQQTVYVVKTYINDSIPINFYVNNMHNVIEQTFINNGIIIDGIIGCDFLYDNEIIIDFKNKTISNIR